MKHGHNFKDISGEIFGRLTAIRYIGRDSYKRSVWRFLCCCGNKKNISAAQIMAGRTRSCGCLEAESRITSNTIHGLHNSPEYGVWCAMKRRCYSPKSSRYYRYGARGITVCKRWKHSFENFILDMGRRPSKDHTIERKNNDGNYCKKNCRWAHKVEQGLNRSNNRIVTFNGRKMVAAQAAFLAGVPYKTFWARLKRGWRGKRLYSSVR